MFKFDRAPLVDLHLGFLFRFFTFDRSGWLLWMFERRTLRTVVRHSSWRLGCCASAKTQI